MVELRRDLAAGPAWPIRREQPDRHRPGHDWADWIVYRRRLRLRALPLPRSRSVVRTGLGHAALAARSDHHPAVLDVPPGGLAGHLPAVDRAVLVRRWRRCLHHFLDAPVLYDHSP